VLAESYLHRLNPFAIQLTDTIGLRWYGIAYIGGFITGWVMLRWMGRRKISPLHPDKAGDLLFTTVLGVLLGGRIGYGLFYDQSMFYTFTSDIPWWEVLAIHHGGMSSHGGMIGVLLAVIIWSKKHHFSALHIMDIGATCALPGLFYGRLANFINAELWGKALPEAMQTSPPWWSVKYPTEIIDVWLSSPNTYESKLVALETLRSSVLGDASFYSNVVSQAYAGDQTVIQTIQPLLTAWYPSQLFQAIANGPIVFAAIVLLWWKPRRPGVIAGWFLVVYGALRVFTEIYRQPDVGVPLTFGLSRGQNLSLIMVLLGIGLMWFCSNRNSKKLGGFSTAIVHSSN